MKGVSGITFDSWLSFAAALALHGALVLALLSSPQAPGAAVSDSAAISLNLIETLIIDASDEAAAETKEATDAAIDDRIGAREDAAPSPLQEQKNAIEEVEELRTHGKKADTPAAAEPKQEKRTAQPSKAQRKGGARSRSASEKKKTSSGAVSASRGAVNSYLGRVRARVASRRPRNMRGRGTAVVSFGISRSGAVRYVRLARSSGNKALDSAALGAVRRAAPFPRPPAGMSLRQLSFRIPFYFR